MTDGSLGNPFDREREPLESWVEQEHGQRGGHRDARAPSRGSQAREPIRTDRDREPGQAPSQHGQGDDRVGSVRADDGVEDPHQQDLDEERGEREEMDPEQSRDHEGSFHWKSRVGVLMEGSSPIC
ncbi:MAG: hypothetical protein R3E12_10245 [Candidatus Eisenbacteria bacterium]